MTSTPPAPGETGARGNARRRPPAWLAFLGVGLALVAAHDLLEPHGGRWLPPLLVHLSLDLASVVAVAHALRRARPGARRPWTFVTLAAVSYLVADTVFYVRRYALDDTAFPHPGDLLYLAMYPLLTAALLSVGRDDTRNRSRAALLDGLVVGAAGAMLSWHFVLQEFRDRGPLLFLSASFPLLDVVVLVALLGAVGKAARSPSLALLAAAIAMQLAGDVAHAVQLLHGTFGDAGLDPDRLWMLFPVGVGAAALHPSMVELSVPRLARVAVPDGLRLGALAAAAGLGPVMLTTDRLTSTRADHAVIATGSVVVVGLVFCRLHGLMRERESALADVLAAQQRVHEREAQLGETVAALEASRDERARLLERTVRFAEHERMRVALALHDGPIQHLASIGYTIDRIDMSLETGDADRARALLEGTREHLSEELRSLRRLMGDLRPPALDDGGIEAALRVCTEELEERTGITCTFTGGLLPGRLDADTETTIFRIAQETLTNVARHARATHAGVELTSVHDGVLLAVWDDGVGFDVAARRRAAPTDSLGLLAIRERVESLDGTYRILSRLGHGTRVEVTLPLRPGLASPLGHGPASARLLEVA